VTAAAERLAVGQVTQLAERRSRELYALALVALARRGRVPNVALGHLAVRVLLFLIGQRPGYFAHQKVIAVAVESNLTSVRGALAELRDAGLVSWELIPPHHPLPTGNYTRTNVNRYYVEAAPLLAALEGADATAPPKTVAPTHPNSGASTGTDLRSELDPPLPPNCSPKPRRDGHATEGEIQFSKFHGVKPATGQARATAAPMPRANHGHATPVPPELEKVLAAWRALNLGEPDDRSVRALRNRHDEGAAAEQLAAAVAGAKHDEWLRQGRAKSPFAVVFASLESVARFAAAGQEHARRAEAAARRRAAEHRAARDLLSTVAAPCAPDNARLAAAALRAVLGKTAAGP